MKELHLFQTDTSPAAVKAAALNREGVELQKAGKLNEALEKIQQAIAAEPKHPAYVSNYGAFLANAKEYAKALPYFLKAAELDASYVPVHENLCVVFATLGEIDACITACENGLELNPRNKDLLDALIFYGDYVEDQTPENALRLRQFYRQVHIDPLPRFREHANTRMADRQLRVGYVSGDYCNHSAMGTFIPVLECHSSAIYPIAYSSTDHDKLNSATTVQLKQKFKEWHDIRGLHDDDAARLIREHQIDVLVDLSGYSRDNRLGIFGRRPCPVQVHGWGCMVGTTGLDCFDLIFADPWVVAPGTERLYTERIVNLPNIIAFAPPSEEYECKDTPALSKGYMTFGSFNRLIKITQQTLDLWASVLKALPTSRFLLKTTSQVEEPCWERYRNEFGERGVDPARIEVQGQTSRAINLLRYNDVDLVLDPYPHGGGVTSGESMWMGVAPITLVGQTVVSRLSYSFLSAVGLAEKFAAESPKEYVERAVYWSEHVQDLNWQRRRLRQRMQQSAWLDHQKYAKLVEQAYREAWQRWLATTSASSST